MKCKTCSAEFEGDFCPACATPARKSKNQICFYKNPWFWISMALFICLIINLSKGSVSTEDTVSSSSATKNTVSEFLADSFEPDNPEPSDINSNAILESSSKIKLTNATAVYITPSGKRYHLSQKCAGKNAIATNLEKAKDEEKTPCQRCAKQSKD